MEVQNLIMKTESTIKQHYGNCQSVDEIAKNIFPYCNEDVFTACNQNEQKKKKKKKTMLLYFGISYTQSC